MRSISTNAQYFDEAGANHPDFYLGHRVIHMRFHEIWNEILEQLKNTTYYQNNRSLIDRAIQKTRTTTDTILSTAASVQFHPGEFNGLQTPTEIDLTLTNIRAHAWFFDEVVNCPQRLCNVVQPVGSKDGRWFDLPASHPEKKGQYGYTPIKPWVSIDTFTDFNKIVREMCIETWRPNFRYQPGVVSAYTRLNPQ